MKLQESLFFSCRELLKVRKMKIKTDQLWSRVSFAKIFVLHVINQKENGRKYLHLSSFET